MSNITSPQNPPLPFPPAHLTKSYSLIKVVKILKNQKNFTLLIVLLKFLVVILQSLQFQVKNLAYFEMIIQLGWDFLGKMNLLKFYLNKF